MQQSRETVALERDVIGVLIPAGTRVELPEGASAQITQALGGSYTIMVEGHLFRIDGSDADALGKEVEPPPDIPDDADQDAIEEAVWKQLATCYDPEIPVNIVDLGLIYSLEVSDEEKGKRVHVKMTLTAPGCGMGPALASDAEQRVLTVSGVSSASVELVWDPPWSPALISAAGRERLGME